MENTSWKQIIKTYVYDPWFYIKTVFSILAMILINYSNTNFWLTLIAIIAIWGLTPTRQINKIINKIITNVKIHREFKKFIKEHHHTVHYGDSEIHEKKLKEIWEKMNTGNNN